MQALLILKDAYMIDDEEIKGRAKGGKARAKKLTPEQRSEIAKKGAVARWGATPIHVLRKGNFKEEFGIDIDCYVLDDKDRNAVISQRGMSLALGLSKGGGRIQRLIDAKVMSPFIGPELREKLENPLIFQSSVAAKNILITANTHGYDVTNLIDLCNAIIRADKEGALSTRYENIGKQAQIVLNASAKAGIKGLVYALAGYNPTTHEVIAAFKVYIQEEARKYEKEFPSELYTEWHRLYEIPVPIRGKPWHFKHLTVRHIYYPLAKSNGRILELMRALKSDDGDRNKKLFQFLNEVGARALRMQLGRVLEMSESSKTKIEYENKISERFGGQQDFDF